MPDRKLVSSGGVCDFNQLLFNFNIHNASFPPVPRVCADIYTWAVPSNLSPTYSCERDTALLEAQSTITAMLVVLSDLTKQRKLMEKHEQLEIRLT
ncbi:hypothetical protein BaRGS_00037061 [Batillaria attramentaria]|uniref:Uncharacterized protein n=1 Tax=Batillaria attramentaria TaxID=370345 RepID=A0ABD0J9Q4_9CAEN